MARKMIVGAGASTTFPEAPSPTISSLSVETGSTAGGTAVRLNMTFVPTGGTLNVTVGGVAATVVAVAYGDGGYIDITTPAHAEGPADVDVVHVYGTTNSPVSFTFISASLAAGTYTASPGNNSVTLAATAPTGGTGPYTYQHYRKTTGAYSALAGATTKDWVDNTALNNTAYTYKLEATDSLATMVAYTERTVTPGNYVAPTIASADFEDGTRGVFTGGIYTAVVDDPTGLFGGKVGRIEFTTSGGSIDRSLSWVIPIASSYDTPGEAFHIAADICCPAPDVATWSAMRKLLYVNPSSGIAGAPNAVFKIHGVNGSGVPLVKVEVQPEPDGSSFLATVGTFEWDEKHHWEMAMIFNSALDANDGSLRIYKDGVLVYEKANYFPWLRSTVNGGVRSAKFGEQYQSTLPTSEYRYFDNIALSQQRIGP